MPTREQLLKMSEARLADLATDEFGLTLPEDVKKIEIVDLILDVQTDDATPNAESPVVEEKADSLTEETTKVAELAAAVTAPTKKVKQVFTRARIIVHNQDGPDNTPFIKVGWNGNMFQIPREVESVVPMAVVNILNDASITAIEPTSGGPNGQVEYAERAVRRHPFSIIEKLP